MNLKVTKSNRSTARITHATVHQYSAELRAIEFRAICRETLLPKRQVTCLGMKNLMVVVAMVLCEAGCKQKQHYLIGSATFSWAVFGK